jgi:hypothetical protein
MTKADIDLSERYERSGERTTSCNGWSLRWRRPRG